MRRAEQWRWGSLYRWKRGSTEDKQFLSTWLVSRRPGWLDYVNQPQAEAELTTLRRSVARGAPYGGEAWSTQAVRRLGLETTLRTRGRPRKGG